jgi:hypothetical protein
MSVDCVEEDIWFHLAPLRVRIRMITALSETLAARSESRFLLKINKIILKI